MRGNHIGRAVTLTRALTSRRAALGRLASLAALLAMPRTAAAYAPATPRAASAEGEAPNRFTLSGEETQITLDLPSATGGARLTYRGPYGDLSLTGSNVVVQECALGQLVTGYLGAFPDQGDLWLTVLIQRFNPVNMGEAPTPCKTLAILKWVISGIAGPPRTGALEEYRVVPVEGTAHVVRP